ncbi:hypothetical protein SEA_PARTRIDGE_49 [Rhodococcus phage Partridge]|uniref:Uncharacterized protein n=1 Tax=Rhodococcus phage Partridge TaxID=1897441 RepID=A0A1I9S7W4_9CAUD|nr:hypothetical protein SEA_PARTRIDGE_49 [Rhodococcus phage Partridge]
MTAIIAGTTGTVDYNHETVYRITQGGSEGKLVYIPEHESLEPDYDNDLYVYDVETESSHGYVNVNRLAVAGFKVGTQVRLTGLTSFGAGTVVAFAVGDEVEVSSLPNRNGDVGIKAGYSLQHIDPKNLVLASTPVVDLTIDSELPLGVELVNETSKQRWVLTPESVPNLFRSEGGSWITWRGYPEGSDLPLISVAELERKEAEAAAEANKPRVFENLWSVPQGLNVTDKDGDPWKFFEDEGWGLGNHSNTDPADFDFVWSNPNDYAPFTEVKA